MLILKSIFSVVCGCGPEHRSQHSVGKCLAIEGHPSNAIAKKLVETVVGLQPYIYAPQRATQLRKTLLPNYVLKSHLYDVPCCSAFRQSDTAVKALHMPLPKILYVLYRPQRGFVNTWMRKKNGVWRLSEGDLSKGLGL